MPVQIMHKKFNTEVSGNNPGTGICMEAFFIFQILGSFHLFGNHCFHQI